MGTLAPDGWLYLEVAIDEEDAPGDSLVVWACSSTCATSMWKVGPGVLGLATPDQSGDGGGT